VTIQSGDGRSPRVSIYLLSGGGKSTTATYFRVEELSSLQGFREEFKEKGQKKKAFPSR